MFYSVSVSCLFRSIVVDANMRRYSFVLFFIIYLVLSVFFLFGKCLLSDGKALFCIVVAAVFRQNVFQKIVSIKRRYVIKIAVLPMFFRLGGVSLRFYAMFTVLNYLLYQ